MRLVIQIAWFASYREGSCPIYKVGSCGLSQLSPRLKHADMCYFVHPSYELFKRLFQKLSSVTASSIIGHYDRRYRNIAKELLGGILMDFNLLWLILG